MMTTAIIRTAALADLHLHDFNPRQKHDDNDITALSKSIAVNGLIQNLSVLDGPDGLGVVAGGRRLRALQLLATSGTDIIDGVSIDFDAIPINATTDEMLARSWAGSEGATQRPLHPAEEIRAYSAMEKQGNSPETIAAAFGQTETHVKRRLKLSHLSDLTLQALQDDNITLDVAKVLTLSDRPDVEFSMLHLATDRGYNADRLRREMLEGKISSKDRRVSYIGLDLYKSEGGALDEDLFTDNSMLHNVELIDNLYQIKLTKAAEDMQGNNGWAKVVPIFEVCYGFWDYTSGMKAIHRQPVDLPDGDATRLQELLDLDREFTVAEGDEADTLEARQLGDYDDDDRARATVFIRVGSDGKTDVSDPFIPNDARSAGDGSNGGVTKVAAKPQITNGGLEDLQKIQLLALQTKMLSQPQMALDLLAFQFFHDVSTWSGPFNIQANKQPITPSSTDGVQIDARLTKDFDTDADTVTGDVDAAFAAFVKLGQKHRNSVLTQAFCKTMNAPFASPTSAAVVAKLDVSPRSVWTPTADNFFKACRSEYLDSIWRTLTITDGDGQMERFTKLKVTEKRKELESLFNDTSTQEALGLSRDQISAIDAWLPYPLLTN